MRGRIALLAAACLLFAGCTQPPPASGPVSEPLPAAPSSARGRGPKTNVPSVPQAPQEDFVPEYEGYKVVASMVHAQNNRLLAFEGRAFFYQNGELCLQPAGDEETYWHVIVANPLFFDADKLKAAVSAGEQVRVYGAFLQNNYDRDRVLQSVTCTVQLPEKDAPPHQVINLDRGTSYTWGDFNRDGIAPVFVPPQEPAGQGLPPEDYDLQSYYQSQMPFGYTVMPFSEGLAQVAGKYEPLYSGSFIRPHGYINTAGEWVIPFGVYGKYGGSPFERQTYSFHEGLAPFYSPVEDGIGYINNQGEIVIQPSPERHTEWRFQNGLAMVNQYGSSGSRYMDRTGRLLDYWEAPDWPWFLGEPDASEGLHVIVDPTSRLCGYMAPDEQVVIAPQYQDAQFFHEGLAAVQDVESGLYGYIDKSGSMVIAPQFLFAGSFVNGRAMAWRPEDVGEVERFSPPYHLFCYIDTAGVPVTQSQFYIPERRTQGGDFSIPGASDHTNGVAVVYTLDAGEIPRVINLQGEAADFKTDLTDLAIQDWEKRYAGQWQFNEGMGTVRLYTDRTAVVYNSYGQRVAAGLWAAIPAGNGGLMMQLEGMEGLVYSYEFPGTHAPYVRDADESALYLVYDGELFQPTA